MDDRKISKKVKKEVQEKILIQNLDVGVVMVAGETAIDEEAKEGALDETVLVGQITKVV